jgi:esterase/lipase superfamily enzyme
MVWVVFTEKFHFTPDADRRATVVYKPSDEPRQVTRECAERAIAKGAARRSQKPRKVEEPAAPAPDAAEAGDAQGASHEDEA